MLRKINNLVTQVGHAESERSLKRSGGEDILGRWDGLDQQEDSLQSNVREGTRELARRKC